MILSRRRFFFLAPAVVASASLMPISTKLLVQFPPRIYISTPHTDDIMRYMMLNWHKRLVEEVTKTNTIVEWAMNRDTTTADDSRPRLIVGTHFRRTWDRLTKFSDSDRS